MVRVSVCCVLAMTAVAHAEPEDAKQLFHDGRALAKAGRYTEACEKFERSFALDPETGTQVNLADCLEHLGQLRRAWQTFDDAAAASSRAGNESRAKFARDHADAIAPRLAVVVVRVAEPGLAGLRVSIAGRTVPAAAELRDRVEPGDIAVVATAPARRPFAQSARADAGATVEIVVPALEDSKLADPPRAIVGGGAPSQPPSPRPTLDVTATAAIATPRRARGRVRLAMILGGAGVISGGAGLALAIVAKGRYDAAVRAHDIASANRQVPLADAGTGLGIAAAALAATSAIVFLTAPRERIVVAPAASSSTIGAVVAGSF